MFNFNDFIDNFNRNTDISADLEPNLYINSRLASCIMAYLRSELPKPCKEITKWTDLKDGTEDLDVFSVMALNSHILFIESFLFGAVSLGMVSHQIKALKIRYNELQRALIMTDLQRAIKTELVIENLPSNNGIQKNSAYDPEVLPYKYYSNKTIRLNIIVDISLLPQEFLGLLRLYGISMNIKADD